MKWIWSLLRAGKIEQAQAGHEVLLKKFEMGILYGETSDIDLLSQFLTSIKNKQVGNQNNVLGQI